VSAAFLLVESPIEMILKEKKEAGIESLKKIAKFNNKRISDDTIEALIEMLDPEETQNK
jgi:hypothetical protein